MSEGELYAGREQTLVKHFVLQKYLERFARIVGTQWDGITYVDCFSGPWNVQSDDLKDSSFSISLAELQRARKTLQTQGRDLTIRCFFLEKDPNSFKRLNEWAGSVKDATIETRNAELEAAIGDIVRFANAGSKCFPFIFIDPTGWKGFGMSTIEPLLKLRPSEVLINFMTGHIRRFVETPHQEVQESFAELFGSREFKNRLAGLREQDREDMIVREYCANVQRSGRFDYVWQRNRSTSRD